MVGLISDRNNPHVFGLNAQEVFFLEDGIILVEGQEDVVFLERVEAGVQIELQGNVFGWGVGGAEKMGIVAQLLWELGFKRVVGILDGNKAATAEELKSRFPNYGFFSIPADDIRSKPARPEKPAVTGLLDEKNMSVRPELVDQTIEVFDAVNSYLNA